MILSIPLTFFSKAWRVWYGSSVNGNQLAIGELWRERFVDITHILWEQLLLLLLVMPLMLGLLFWVLRKSLRPLRSLAESIYQRHPKDLTPISQQTSSELQPLVKALNELLRQVTELLDKEQRFIADTSHELRSPLTAISRSRRTNN